MSPRKLTESDKKEILDLYRMPQETTSTLADRYQVSSSTISRFLKSNLAENEYEELIQQKRLSRTPTGAAQVLSWYEQQQDFPESPMDWTPTPEPPTWEVEAEPEEAEPAIVTQAPKLKRSRTLASVEQLELLSSETPEKETPEKETPEKESREKPKPKLIITQSSLPKKKVSLATVVRDEDYLELDEEENDVHTLEEMLGEDIGDLDDDLDDYEEDWDDDEDEDELPLTHNHTPTENVHVLPLSEATFPRTCYLVIDRSGELITRPLQEFGDLGDIPLDETHQETLPVFDNHRVARRFSKRSQRVIKVPDGNLFNKTQPYLHAKGITRLLLDGQVYSLGRN